MARTYAVEVGATVYVTAPDEETAFNIVDDMIQGSSFDLEIGDVEVAYEDED